MLVMFLFSQNSSSVAKGSAGQQAAGADAPATAAAAADAATTGSGSADLCEFRTTDGSLIHIHVAQRQVDRDVHAILNSAAMDSDSDDTGRK